MLREVYQSYFKVWILMKQGQRNFDNDNLRFMIEAALYKMIPHSAR